MNTMNADMPGLTRASAIRTICRNGMVNIFMERYGPSVNGKLDKRLIDASFWQKMELLSKLLNAMADRKTKARNPGFGLPEGTPARQAGYLTLPMDKKTQADLFKAAAREVVEKIRVTLEKGGRFTDPELADFAWLAEPMLEGLFRGQKGTGLWIDAEMNELMQAANRFGLLVELDRELSRNAVWGC